MPYSPRSSDYIAILKAKCPTYSFVRWDGACKNQHSKAVMVCQKGHAWAARVDKLIEGTGCRQCGAESRAKHSASRKRPEAEVLAELNRRTDASFVRWDAGYRNKYSKAVMQCASGHEWVASVASLLKQHTGCPSCSIGGYDKSKPGTLYILRSECGSMVKIGISNDYRRRHRELHSATPFNWRCAMLIHCQSGAFIAGLEQKLHAATIGVNFGGLKFDGHTEWREWGVQLPSLLLKARRRAALLTRTLEFIG